MLSEERSMGLAMVEEESIPNPRTFDKRSGFDSESGIYHAIVHLEDNQKIPTEPNLDIATFVLSQFPPPGEAETRLALIDSATGDRLTYAQLHQSIKKLATGLYHGLGVKKGDVVFILSPNTIMYPAICIAVMSIGAVITTANPVNTATEIAKQVRDSGATLAIAAPEEAHKLSPTRIPVLFTSHCKDDNQLSVQELIENCDLLEIPRPKLTQSDTAAILYSSGTTGTSKGVVLTHSNFISVMMLLRWSVQVSDSLDDVFLSFIPMFHIYGFAFFGLGLFCSGITTVLMQKFDFQEMLGAIEKYKVNNIPVVPPVLIGLVKYSGKAYDLTSLRRMGSGAAPLSKDVVDGFRKRYPWIQLRQGYGLTETCGSAAFFANDEEAKIYPASCGRLVPSFRAKVVDPETGAAMPPNKTGELWLKSQAVMKGYLRNEEATAEIFDSQGWLKTGDVCYLDDEGHVFIVGRIKELIKHNGYQVAPAELEAILLGHPQILDAAVIPHEDEAAGEIPVACVVRTENAELTEDQIIEFVASQVAPYKKIRRVVFVQAIPRSTAGKILRRELVQQSKRQVRSKL